MTHSERTPLGDYLDVAIKLTGVEPRPDRDRWIIQEWTRLAKKAPGAPLAKSGTDEYKTDIIKRAIRGTHSLTPDTMWVIHRIFGFDNFNIEAKELWPLDASGRIAIDLDEFRDALNRALSENLVDPFFLVRPLRDKLYMHFNMSAFDERGDPMLFSELEDDPEKAGGEGKQIRRIPRGSMVEFQFATRVAGPTLLLSVVKATNRAVVLNEFIEISRGDPFREGSTITSIPKEATGEPGDREAIVINWPGSVEASDYGVAEIFKGPAVHLSGDDLRALSRAVVELSQDETRADPAVRFFDYRLI